MTQAFQISGFQNPIVGDHLGFQITLTPEAKGIAAAITIDQTIHHTADQWELAMNNEEPFFERSKAGTVDLSIGLIDALGNSQLVKHVKEGRIDEWELEFSPNQTIGRLRGRDAMAFALDTTLFITYLSGGVQIPPTPPQDLPIGLRPIPGVTTRINLPGNWHASTICEDLAKRVGLECSYQAPDYRLRTDVTVSGPAGAAIQQLIAPFSSFAPYKVDVSVE